MLLLYYISVGLLVAYGFLIRFYHRAWLEIPDFMIEHPEAVTPATRVTVIVPARNEEDNIGPCLDALSQQSYPGHLVEIIVVNDHSTDRTAEIITAHPGGNIRLINLKDHLHGAAINSYKKKAIEVAVAAAAGELILTTDADCIAPPHWITSMATFRHRYQAAFIAAPVRITTGGSLLAIFQALDFTTLQGITGASVYKKFHSMCNGANLAYTKQVFYEAGGFAGIDDIASGDDMMLMHKIATLHPDRVLYLKSKAAIVSTLPADSWKAFFRQRIRWASKAGKYKDRRITAVLLLVYVVNVLLLLMLAAGIVHRRYLVYFAVLLVLKTVVEYPFVKKVAAFFSQQQLMGYFILLQPVHIIYTVVAGWLGMFGHYEWKSRKVK